MTCGAHVFHADTSERIAQGRAAADPWIVENGMQDELIEKLYAGLRPAAPDEDVSSEATPSLAAGTESSGDASAVSD